MALRHSHHFPPSTTAPSGGDAPLRCLPDGQRGSVITALAIFWRTAPTSIGRTMSVSPPSTPFARRQHRRRPRLLLNYKARMNVADETTETRRSSTRAPKATRTSSDSHARTGWGCEMRTRRIETVCRRALAEEHGADAKLA